MGEPFDHGPPGWIGQSRKRCTQFIHNCMVVDYLAMSSGKFGRVAPIWTRSCGGFCSLKAGPPAHPPSSVSNVKRFDYEVCSSCGLS